jgi:predicted GNAT family acetyltransferase
MRQRVFRCTRVAVPAAHPNLAFRAANRADLDLLAGWRRSFIDEAFPLGPVRDVYSKTRDLIERRVLYVLERDGTPVSMAHCTRDLGQSCAVTGVYTPPSFRKKGYASLITARLTKLLLDSGKRETSLVANAGNLTSQHIYEAIGYEFVGDAIDVDVSWGKRGGEGHGSPVAR